MTPAPVVYLVTCAAPPVRALPELITLLDGAGWASCVIPTPTAATWIDPDAIAAQTGHPVRHTPRHPDDPNTLPPATAVAVVPATFNTINKWVAGISDTFALGILNEVLGLGLPMVVAPYAKPVLAAHPAFGHSLRTLRNWGITVLANEILRPEHADPTDPTQSFNWQPVVAAITDRAAGPTANG